jgi:hypothetical protein
MPNTTGARWIARNTVSADGNLSFEEYRAQVLRHVEDEQEAFAAFVERLRFARDRSEFDAFMAERRPDPG